MRQTVVSLKLLFASAMIYSMEKDPNYDRVSTRSLARYGSRVVTELSNIGINAILLLDKDILHCFLDDYEDILYYEETYEDMYIVRR